MSYSTRIKGLGKRLLSPFNSSGKQDLLASQQSRQHIQDSLEQQFGYIREALGRIENRQLENSNSSKLTDFEFRVFSQWGEDGIIQHLIRHVAIEREIFVEFGVSDYRESNTRFLLVNNNWQGLVFDSSQEAIDALRGRWISWQHNLKAAQAFITRQNINQLISNHGMSGEIGLLSIDIDGNDYWVWEAIEVINPAIVIVEYNHRFGPDQTVTIPYDESFRRGETHPIFYFGASLGALELLSKKKGYAFVGCNSNGVNAFFVRRDKLTPALKERSAAEGYVAGKFTENQDDHGFYIPADSEKETSELLKLPLIDVSKSR